MEGISNSKIIDVMASLICIPKKSSYLNEFSTDWLHIWNPDSLYICPLGVIYSDLQWPEILWNSTQVIILPYNWAIICCIQMVYIIQWPCTCTRMQVCLLHVSECNCTGFQQYWIKWLIDWLPCLQGSSTRQWSRFVHFLSCANKTTHAAITNLIQLIKSYNFFLTTLLSYIDYKPETLSPRGLDACSALQGVNRKLTTSGTLVLHLYKWVQNAILKYFL